MESIDYEGYEIVKTRDNKYLIVDWYEYYDTLAEAKREIRKFIDDAEATGFNDKDEIIKGDFKDLTIEEMFFEVAGKKFKVFDKDGHFTKEAYKLYDKVANRYGDIDKFDALCDEEGCFEDDEDIQYSTNESLKEEANEKIEIVNFGNKDKFLIDNGFDDEFYFDGSDLVHGATGRTEYRLADGTSADELRKKIKSLAFKVVPVSSVEGHKSFETIDDVEYCDVNEEGAFQDDPGLVDEFVDAGFVLKGSKLYVPKHTNVECFDGFCRLEKNGYTFDVGEWPNNDNVRLIMEAKKNERQFIKEHKKAEDAKYEAKKKENFKNEIAVFKGLEDYEGVPDLDKYEGKKCRITDVDIDNDAFDYSYWHIEFDDGEKFDGIPGCALELIDSKIKKESKKKFDVSMSNCRTETWLEYMKRTGQISDKDCDKETVERLSDTSSYYADLMINGKKVADLIFHNYQGGPNAEEWGELGVDKIEDENVKNALTKLGFKKNNLDFNCEMGHPEVGVESLINSTCEKAFGELVSDIEKVMNAEKIEEYKEFVKHSNRNDKSFKKDKVIVFGKDAKLKEEARKVPYGLLAWQLNEIISSMNNEEAYYGSWLYIWPDGEDRQGAIEDFETKEDYQDLEDLFVKLYKAYHDDGLYNVSDKVLERAHKWDKKLGLEPIIDVKKENVSPRVDLDKELEEEE